MVIPQLSAVARYTWDSSITTSSGNSSGMNVVSYGITSLASAINCVDGSCVNFMLGSYLELPMRDFGLYKGTSFSFWFKPMSGCGANARLLAFGNSFNDSMLIGRSVQSQKLEFIVRRPNMQAAVYVAEDNTWQESVWKHIIWTILPLTSARDSAVWEIYINGTLAAAVDGLFPTSYANAFVGKGISNDDAPFVGYMDSLTVFPDALSDNEIRLVYEVSVACTCLAALVYDVSNPCYTNVQLSKYLVIVYLR
jgi:hypothetical protein